MPLSSELLESVQQFDSKSLYWLSGYCSGLADAKGSNVSSALATGQAPVTVSQSLDQVALKTVVLYASQSGNAEKLAAKLYEQLGQSGVKAELASVADFKAKTLKEQQVILLVASTHGEGEPPDDAIEFHEFVLGKRAPKLEGVKHAVLSLGDSSYEFFCQTGKDFDQALTKLGSTPLVERVDCDLDYEESAASWMDSVVNALKDLSGARGPVQAATNQEVVVASEWTKEKPFTATIIDNQKITGRGSVKHINHIEISLAGSGIQYQPGDALGVWAKNNADTVAEIIALSGVTGKESIKLKNSERSLRDALSENLEISLLNKELIKQYAEISNSEQLKDVVENRYADFVKNHQFVDLLKLAPVKLEAQELVDLLKPIKPRMYSIASSLEANPEEVHLTVALAESENENGKRLGTASQFLTETLQEDDEVLVFVEENRHFKLPAKEQPVIMIGPGTGIAPFRAFLQERDETDAEGENWLFFGNPNFNTDFLYQTELQEYLKTGILSKVELAFSRDQAEKIYVQDRLLENAAEIWQWLNEKGAYLYVCGDMNHMAKDVEAALLDIIQAQGGKNREQAEAYLKGLKKDKRYQRDVY